MPLIQDDDTSTLDTGRLTFRERLRTGRVVPIVSNRATFDRMLGGYAPFLAGYARYVKFPSPLGQPDSLTTLVKYHKHRPRDKPLTDQDLKFDYLNFVKNHLYRQAKADSLDQDTLDAAAAEMDRVSASEFANRLGYPRFTGRDDPLLLLANLPFKTVLTTSPLTFIEDALRRAGKAPRTEVCRWTKDLKDTIPTAIDDRYQPSDREPLVYHLLGLDRYVDSLVLSEDDYLDYLGNLCEKQGDQSADYVPALVRRAFSDDLIVLGFSLDSWAFRVLYAGLIKRSGKAKDRGVCEIQLPDRDVERAYLQDYLEREAKFQVFWGSLEEYALAGVVQHMTQTPLPPNPYVGPRTFTEQEGRFFFGREREARDLTARIVSERLLLFYAQSGAGKSSLLNARVIPKLRDEERFQVLPVGRVSGELPAGLEATQDIFAFNLMTSLEQGGAEPTRLAGVTLSDFLARLARETVVDAGGQRVQRWVYKPEIAIERSAVERPAAGATQPAAVPRFVLIIDQFEELITGHPGRWLEREDFFRQLNQALLDDPNLWVVLTLREDYVAALDPYAELTFNRLRARFYMERMGVAAALDAICEPTKLGGRSFAVGVAEQLVDNLRQVRVPGQEETIPGQYVEPVQLQVVCYQLWENIKQRPPGLITATDLQEAGDVDRALTQFYEETLATVLAGPAAAGISERQLRGWFDEDLITEAGTRGLVHQGETDAGGVPNDAVRALQRRFLVRAEARGGDAWIELVHDRFVEPIRASNRAWLARNLNPLTQAAQTWLEAGKPEGDLYTDSQLEAAAAQLEASPSEFGEAERAFVEAGQKADARRTVRRQRMIVWGAVALSLIFIALAAGLWLSLGQARVQTQEAQKARDTAVAAQQGENVARKQAETDATSAVAAQLTAEAARMTAAADRDSVAALAVNLAAVLTAQAIKQPSTSTPSASATSPTNATLTTTIVPVTVMPTEMPTPEWVATISAAQYVLATVEARQTVAATTFTVYIQVPTETARDQVKKLQVFLQKQGYIVPDIDVVGPDRSPRASEIRYLYQNQATAARLLQEDLVQAGLEDFVVKYVPGYEGRARQDVIEVWFKK